jgi:branched-chain amino acid transport system substrate-binding protein
MLARVMPLIAMAVFLLAGIAPSSALAQTGPIKVGLLVPLTGAASALGKDMLAGTELYLDEINRQVAGRKIELIVEDTEGVTATALTKARKLVDQDRVAILTGGLLASTGYALHPFADAAKIPTTYPVMSSDDLTQRKPAKWVVRTGWNSSQSMQPFGEWVAKNLKYRKVATVGFDYAFGWETVGGFQRTFEEQGGQVIQKIWTPLNTTDFSPFIAQIKPDAEPSSPSSSGGIVAVREAVRGIGAQGEDPPHRQRDAHRRIGAPPDGRRGPRRLHRPSLLGRPRQSRQQEVRKAFEAKAGKVPSYYAETCYTNMRWIVEAIKAINGKVEDREALPRGSQEGGAQGLPARARGHRPVGQSRPEHLRAQGGAGRRSAPELRDFHLSAVSQFWKYNPDEFLKQPLYTRDYPPCKHC